MAKMETGISNGLLAVLVCLVAAQEATVAGILDKQQQLEAQTFWDNRDWDWYKANIPFFECPDAEVNTTYYYRWELTTKHLTYGSPVSGYSYTEFIDRPFWSGAYGAISCPAGHQLYEVRWLGDGRHDELFLIAGERRHVSIPFFDQFLRGSLVRVSHEHELLCNVGLRSETAEDGLLSQFQLFGTPARARAAETLKLERTLSDGGQSSAHR